MAGTWIKVRDEKIGTDRYVEYNVTSGATADEEALQLQPGQKITVSRLDVTLVSGTGTTVDPALGVEAAFSAGDFGEKGSDITGAPAARVGTTENLPIKLGADGKLYIQHRVDAAADNVIRVGLHISDGWI